MVLYRKYVTLPLYYIFVLVMLSFTMFQNVLLADETFTFYQDNDNGSLKNTDRHYTNGTKFMYAFTPDWNWLNNWGTRFMSDTDNTSTAFGVLAGQNMYTPDHVGSPHKRPRYDMRFNGYLYSGVFIQKSDPVNFERLELNLGVIGPSSMAEQMQKGNHKIVGAPKPKGWDGQLEDEFAFDFSFQRKLKFSLGSICNTLDSEWIPHAGYTVGSVHRHLNAGMTYRIGVNLPSDFGPGRLDDIHDVTRKNGSEWKSTYFFIRTDGFLVDHNRFMSRLSPEPAQGQLQFGLVFLFNEYEIGVYQLLKTREFKHQNSFDTISTFTFTWRF